MAMKRRPLYGGPAKVTYKPKKKVTPAPKTGTARPIPADRIIRKPGDPRPSTWRGAKKRTSPMRRRSR